MSQEGSPVQGHTSYEVSARKSQSRGPDTRFAQSFLSLESAKNTFIPMLEKGIVDHFAIYEIPGKRGCENIPVFTSTELSKALDKKKLDLEIDWMVANIRSMEGENVVERSRVFVQSWLDSFVRIK